MLVLTRKQNERIKIGDDIVVSVLKIKGNTVRLGIETPKEVRVVRGELPASSEPRVKSMTLFATDPSTGAIREHDAEPSRTSEIGPSIRGQKIDPLDEEVNRLKQIVSQVSPQTWTPSEMRQGRSVETSCLHHGEQPR